MTIFGISIDALISYASLISVIVGIILTAIPMIIALVSAIKAKRKAKTEAEQAAADAEMTKCAQDLIITAEAAYKAVDTFLKQQGTSAGAVKKESVLTKLRAYALDHNFKFDIDFWSKKVDELVALTKQVNVK